MATATRSFTGKFALLLVAVAAGGCSHTPNPLSETAPGIAGFFTSGLHAGALQTSRIDVPAGTAKVSAKIQAPACPGAGDASCERNWWDLQEGLSASEVSDLLGEPASQDGPNIFVDKVVAEWSYAHQGVVYFVDGALQYVDMPKSFAYEK